MEIIESERVTTQAGLAERLEEAGFPCTQASISRDVRELGLVKRNGTYTLPGDNDGDSPPADELGSSVAPFIRSATVVGENLVVVQTVTGTANSVGLLMDRAGWPGLVGTVAGDDTIIAAVTDREAGQAVVRRVLSIGRSDS
jgi:transcriptional regulator of arginine metabolism